MPKGYGYDFGGITREESQQSGTTVIIFGICILMIYLILSALYESFLIPFAVILAVPAGLMGSFLFARIAGLENNIYLQTGLIMLIGLLAKTAILLTEYAAERRKAGMGLIASAVSAAKARFRPILMTVLTMISAFSPWWLPRVSEPTVTVHWVRVLSVVCSSAHWRCCSLFLSCSSVSSGCRSGFVLPNPSRRATGRLRKR